MDAKVALNFIVAVFIEILILLNFENFILHF